MPLASGAVRGPPAPEDYLAQRRAAAGAGQPSPSVRDQERSVPSAFAVDHLEVPERGSLALDRRGQYRPYRGVQFVRASSAHPAGHGMDPRDPQGFVGIDVSDSCYRALAQEERFDVRGRSSEDLGEDGGIEVIRERLGAQRGKGRDGRVVALLDYRETSEATGVAERKLPSIVERKRGSRPRVLSAEGEGARHPEVHDQLEASSKWSDHELPAPPDMLDPVSDRALDILELARDRGQGIGPCLSDGASRQLRIELTANRFDLR